MNLDSRTDKINESCWYLFYDFNFSFKTNRQIFVRYKVCGWKYTEDMGGCEINNGKNSTHLLLRLYAILFFKLCGVKPATKKQFFYYPMKFKKKNPDLII